MKRTKQTEIRAYIRDWIQRNPLKNYSLSAEERRRVCIDSIPHGLIKALGDAERFRDRHVSHLFDLEAAEEGDLLMDKVNEAGLITGTIFVNAGAELVYAIKALEIRKQHIANCEEKLTTYATRLAVDLKASKPELQNTPTIDIVKQLLVG